MTCHDRSVRRASVPLIVLLFAVSCTSTAAVNRPPSVGSVILHGSEDTIQLSVEVAESPAEREQGLMGRTSLAADVGMVFLFDDVSEGPVTSEFWMKDTLIPLSVAFWAEDGRIVGIRDMDPCAEDPCPTYASPEPYVGALEVNQGFFSEHGVTIGDRIELVR